MSIPSRYELLAEALVGCPSPIASGRVVEAKGFYVKAEGLAAPVGATARIGRRDGSWIASEVVGLTGGQIELALLELPDGICIGAPVELHTLRPMVMASEYMLGRATDAFGRPADGLGGISGKIPVALYVRRDDFLRKGKIWQKKRNLRELVSSALAFGGPCVAALVGGTSDSHEKFLRSLGEARARTAAILEPWPHPERRSRRAVFAAAALANFFARMHGRAMLLVSWGLDGEPPLGEVELEEEVTAAWTATCCPGAARVEEARP